MKHPNSRSFLLGALGATAALVAVTLAHGGDTGSSATTTTPVNTTPSNSSSAGMMAAKDPVTGALRAPTAEEMAALQPKKAEGLRERKSEPVVRQLPNGTLAITLDQSTELSSVAVKDSEGKLHTACVPADKVEATLKAAQEGGLTKKEVLDEK